jgi:hypothetical protein
VQRTGLIGESKAGAVALFCEVVCMHSSRGNCIGLGGNLHVCRGSSLWFSSFVLVVFCSLLELVFVSVVSSRCPCLRGP